MSETLFLTGVGSNIKNLRLQQGISQSKLASLCQFDRATMSRIESGQSNITLLTLFKIGQALKVKGEEILKGLN